MATPKTSRGPALLGELHKELADGGVVLATDATHAGAWRGDEDERFEDFNDIGGSDEAKKREQRLGDGRCLLLGCGVDTQVFRIGDGLGWIDFHPHDALSAKTKRKLADAMTSARTKGKPKRFGVVVVESGCLALVMAHAPGKVAASAVASATEDGAAIHRYKGGNLLAVRPGTYVAWYDKIEKEEEDGFLVGRLRLEREA